MADVVNMVQTNQVTKYQRKIRSQAVKAGQDAVSQLVWQIFVPLYFLLMSDSGLNKALLIPFRES